MPQGDRAVRVIAALSAGCLAATLVGVVLSSRTGHPAVSGAAIATRAVELAAPPAARRHGD